MSTTRAAAVRCSLRGRIEALLLCAVAAAGCFGNKRNNGGRVEEARETRSRETQAAPAVQAGGGTVVRDASYGSDPAQRLDVYSPPNASKAPVLFIVHGGAWMYGDKANDGFVTNKVSHWLPQGYVVVSTNYRLSPPNP